MKKLICLIITVLMVICNVGTTVHAINFPPINPPSANPRGADEEGFWTGGLYDVELPSVERICELLEESYELPFILYETFPETDNPYEIGTLKEEVFQIGLKRLNFFRELLGLYNLDTQNALNNYAQHAALIGKVNGHISHYPIKPDDFSEELYEYCSMACANSCLAGPKYDLIKAIDAYMTDHQSRRNLTSVGHRQSIMKTGMQYIGIGQVYDFNALYIRDSSYGSLLREWDFISYPASGNMPIVDSFWYENTPWSLKLNLNFFKQPNIDNITITIEKDSEVIWSNTGELQLNANLLGPYMLVNTEGFAGGSHCIIFRPDVTEYTPGEYIVYVDGLRDRNNEPVDFKYKVNMFNPNEVPNPTPPEHNIPDMAFMDGNGDGIVNLVDCIIALRCVMGLLTADNLIYYFNLDTDGDGIVTLQDSIQILRVVIMLS